MGILSGQALPGLLSPHGQVQNLARDGAWHLLRLQQSREWPSVDSDCGLGALFLLLFVYLCIWLTKKAPF